MSFSGFTSKDSKHVLSLPATFLFLEAVSDLDFSASCPWGPRALPSKVNHTSRGFLFLRPSKILFHSHSSFLVQSSCVPKDCPSRGGNYFLDIYEVLWKTRTVTPTSGSFGALRDNSEPVQTFLSFHSLVSVFLLRLPLRQVLSFGCIFTGDF